MEASLASGIIRKPSGHVAAVTPTVIGDVPTTFVIDGDSAVRQSLERLITTTGWRYKPFGSAEEFLPHAREGVPCCVIFDLTFRG
jgi:FixJ family two-component response regulator